MSRLGDYFTSGQKQDTFDATLVPGNIIRIEQCCFTKPPKRKYVALVGRDENACLLFVVNSDPRLYIQGKPRLAECQVSLYKSDYDFLKKDVSYLNCAEVKDVLSAAEIAGELAAGTARYMGSLTSETIEAIIAVMGISTTVMPWHKEIIINSLTWA